ncbi:ArsR/SmtB family transcription factor [Muricoccus radiodurans]|uniref:ArsR/SmtB family transcription factor n=1 Tax=Muricoccus radiodurans TaxID=2231721 RepID=UPI003CF249F6
MPRTPAHPDAAQIDLSAVLDALRDPVRRAIVVMLDERGEKRCASFVHVASKTNLTYHLSRLREAGLVRVRPEGTVRIISLRREELQARFPGLLDAVLESARREPRLSERLAPA